MADCPSDAMRIERYRPEHDGQIRRLLESIGWEDRYVQGQMDAIHQFAAQPELSAVFAALGEAHLSGYVSVKVYEWNRLAQIHGLVVHLDNRKQGIARELVRRAEVFVIEHGARGIYVDTPVNNTGGRAFYERIGYRQDYVMTRYYDEETDGVTYVKFFA